MRRAAWVAVAVLAVAVAYALSREDVRAGIGQAAENVNEGVMDFVAKLTGETAENRARWLPLIQQAEAENGLPPGLLDALLYRESHYRSDIIEGRTVSSANAVGIAQIVPRWHPNVNPLNPAEAIPYAAQYLASMFRQFGSWPHALAAYNWGPGNVAKYGLENLPDETRQYVASITSDAGLA